MASRAKYRGWRVVRQACRSGRLDSRKFSAANGNMAATPHQDVYVNPDDGETIKRLAMTIKTEWTSQKDLKIKDMSSGYINRNVCCYHNTMDDGLFFRMLSEEGTLVDVNEALKVIEFLETQKLCAPLRLMFRNGYCMDFISGDGLTWATRQRQYEPEIRRAIAHEMARYHSRKAYRVAEEYGIAEEYSFLSDDLIIPCFQYFDENKELDDDILKSLPTKEEFQCERDHVIRMMTECKLEKAFCHTDINPSNIIMTEHGARALFVDYDFCRLSYKTIDITWYFLCFVDMTSPDFRDYPDDDYRNQWLREYLQYEWELDGKQRPLTDTNFNLLKYQVTKVHLWAVLEFMYAMLFVVRLGPPPHVTRNELLGCAKKCWDYYMTLRDDIMALTLEDVPMFSLTEKAADD